MLAVTPYPIHLLAITNTVTHTGTIFCTDARVERPSETDLSALFTTITRMLSVLQTQKTINLSTCRFALGSMRNGATHYKLQIEGTVCSK